MTDRERFLEYYWDRYPAARPEWLDVEEFSKTEASAVVCGRVRRAEGESWRLNSAGQEIAFRLEPQVSWMLPLRPGVNRDVPAVTSVLVDNDLIALKLARRGQEWVASECALLAPALVAKPKRPRIGVDRSKAWMEFLDCVRAFFKDRGFVEAWTPTLVPSPGTEPFLDAFETDVIFDGTKRGTFYLPTSPEFHLKKMLAAGWTKIFEIKTCFRNGEAGSHHQLEFQMLEWYRAYATLEAIADDVEGLLKVLTRRFGRGSEQSVVLKRTTVAELFSRAFPGFELKPDTTREELAALAERTGVRILETDTWDEIFFRLFLEKVEPHLEVDGPVLVRDYPPSQAALSRIGASGFADRFEVYWRGLEIANAFHELNDPDENVKRFMRDAEVKKALGKPSFPMDQELVESLRFGMPPSGGIALGLDRLFMALLEIGSIEETRAFPFTGPC